LADNGLVLDTRLSVTKRNLERIQGLTNTIRRREGGVAEMLSLPADFQKKTRLLLNKMGPLSARAIDINDPDLVEAIAEVEKMVRDLWADLGRRAKEADRLREELFEPLGDRQDVKDFLVGAAGDLSRTLTRQNYWKEREKCDTLFSEYVDLLHGIALRSARFGEERSIGELFVIADSLPSVWGRIAGWSWQSVAVPSWLDQRTSTEAMVLRVGFPEWTVWALPLLQHEFAHIFLKRKQLADVDDAVALADALAVLVAGPAYACATLLLRLNPSAVSERSPEVGLRAATIVRTLKTVAEEAKDPTLAPVVQLSKRLEDEWLTAVEDSRGSVEAQKAALDSPAWRAALDVAQSHRPSSGGSRKPLWAEKWGTISLWAGQLAAGTTSGIDLAAEDGPDRERHLSLTLMLNAAWLARIRPDPDLVDVPVDVDEVGNRAVALMLDYLRAPTQPQRPLRNIGP
jgi:hypothetical protein